MQLVHTTRRVSADTTPQQCEVERVSASAGGVLESVEASGVPCAADTLDAADAVDPFQEHLEEEEHTMPPEMVPHEAETSPQHGAAENQAQQPVAMDDLQRHSWWQRVGEVVSSQSLVVGGAAIHHTHLVAAFGNTVHSIVFCARCGGSTQGTFSPQLAEPCRREASETKQRQIHRMLIKHQWLVGAMQCHYGSGSLSPPIRFVEVGSDSFQIAVPDARTAAAHVSGSATAGDCER